jgi:hypothetical protein
MAFRQHNRKRSRSAFFVKLAVLTIFCAAGCDARGKAWQMAYQSNYERGFNEGRGQDVLADRTAAQSAGEQSAKRALTSGTAWVLYRPLAIWSFSSGVLLGIASQFLVLMLFRYQRQLPLFLASALVPGIRRSRAYSLLEINAHAHVEKSSLNATRQLKLWQIRAIQEIVENRLKATANLDELTQSKLLELADQELDKIVAASQYRQDSARAKTPPPTDLRFFNCPTCSKRVKFSRHFANKTRPCPNPECGSAITFPSFDEQVERVADAPPTLQP